MRKDKSELRMSDVDMAFELRRAIVLLREEEEQENRLRETKSFARSDGIPSDLQTIALQEGLIKLQRKRNVAIYQYVIAVLLAICIYQSAWLVQPYVPRGTPVFMSYIVAGIACYVLASTESLIRLQRKVRCLRLGLRISRMLEDNKGLKLSLSSIWEMLDR